MKIIPCASQEIDSKWNGLCLLCSSLFQLIVLTVRPSQVWSDGLNVSSIDWRKNLVLLLQNIHSIKPFRVNAAPIEGTTFSSPNFHFQTTIIQYRSVNFLHHFSFGRPLRDISLATRTGWFKFCHSIFYCCKEMHWLSHSRISLGFDICLTETFIVLHNDDHGY